MQNFSDKQWQAKLTPEQYKIMRQKGTEAPFSGDLLENKQQGTYSCQACGAELFSSAHKFDSNSGWPSFYDVIKSGSVSLKEDLSHGMQRTEVVCSNCGSHLGHLFDDAKDQPTSQRYCINSVCLAFSPSDKDKV